MSIYIRGTDIFQKFMDKTGKFKDSLSADINGMLSLYEASNLGTSGEDLLNHAMEFTETKLRQSIPLMEPQFGRNYSHALELPRHLRMERLEARRFIGEFRRESDQSPYLVELAKLDYNRVQSLHQAELTEISRSFSHFVGIKAQFREQIDHANTTPDRLFAGPMLCQ